MCVYNLHGKAILENSLIFASEAPPAMETFINFVPSLSLVLLPLPPYLLTSLPNYLPTYLPTYLYPRHTELSINLDCPPICIIFLTVPLCSPGVKVGKE